MFFHKGSRGAVVVVLILWAISFGSVSFSQTVKIMPLGDSITQGVGGSSPLHGFRDILASFLDGEGVPYDFVGTLADGEGFDPEHQGVPGARAAQIASDIGGYLASTNPDMVLIHIGTNDITNGQQPASILNNMASIVDAIHGHNGAAKILLSGLIPRFDSANRDNLTRDFNDLIGGLVNQKWEAGYNIRIVDHYGAFTDNSDWQAEYMKDPVHPNDDGYRQMAKTYFAAVQSALDGSGPADPNVVDDFNHADPGLGSNWAAHPAYAVVSDQLANISTQNAWGQMAVWTESTNAGAVAFKWGVGADARGINEGGLALKLSGPSANANGYLIWLGTSAGIGTKIVLWTIENGAPAESVQEIDYSQSEPAAGDIFKVELVTDTNGHHFLCYVNDVFYGRVTDSDKRQGGSYAGVMLKGNLNNDIDDFAFVAPGGGDNFPPAVTTNLAVQSAGPTSVTLQWTASGDDDNIGTAAAYVVRYATAPIDLNNFDAAALAPGAPTPSPAGSVENITVGGLSANTQYYFALKTQDEAGNLSELSNVVSATTTADFSSGDDFERAALGPDWTAHAAFKIVNGELRNTSTQASWNFLAVYNAKKNPVEVAFKWGTTADDAGIDEGGFALMLDAASPTANGYLLWRRPSSSSIELWTIVNGAPNTSVASTQGNQAGPGAGDVMKVALRSNASGHHFDLFINDQFDGTVTDPGKLQGSAANLYAGVMLHGNRKNPIDNFTITPGASTAAQLIYLSGDGQVGTPGEQLLLPFMVGVIDENGIPAQGVPVNFVVMAGGGTLADPQPVLTNAEGKAKTFLTLGTTQALNKVEARSTGLDGSPLTFTAMAKPNSPENLVRVGGGGQTGFAGQTLPSPIQVKVADNLGTGIPSHPVTFTVTAGGGTINQGQSTATVNTDAQGVAQVAWTIGILPGGANTMQVSSSFNSSPLIGSPLSFSATAIVGIAAVDSFSRAELGPDWVAHPAFKIVNKELRNTSTQNSWNFLAVYKAKKNPKEVGFKWGTTANEAGIDEGGFALMLDAASTTANGYLLWRRPSTSSIELWTIVNGAPNAAVSSAQGSQFGPVAGDEVKVGLRSNASGHHFDLYINNQLDGTVSDPDKLQGGAATLYGGVMLHGSRQNPIDNFIITATAGKPAQLVYVSGNGQAGTATTGQQLPNPFVVRVMDDNGIPVKDTPVTFVVTAGGGKLSNAQPVLTNAAGQASTFLTLSTTQTQNTVEARAAGLTGSPIVFTATPKAGNPKNLTKVAGDGQGGSPGQPLPTAIQVKVTDSIGLPVAKHAVLFKILTGGGTINQGQANVTVSTDSQGVAKATWTLGNQFGAANSLEVSSSFGGNPLAGSPITFTATATKPSAIALFSGDAQRGSTSTPLPQPFVVLVKDAANKPVAGQKVTFTVIEGTGKLNGKTTIDITSNGAGQAAATLTMGPTPGAVNKVRATASFGSTVLTGSPITFTATAARLKSLSMVSGINQTGVVGTALALPFKVKILDSLNVGIINQNVTFKVTSGGGKLNGTDTTKIVKTDSLGIASITLTLGPKPGSNNNKVQAATNPPLSGSPFTFQASGQTGPPQRLVKVSGDSISGVVNNPLPAPFVAKVTDNFDNPIANINVTFTVKSGGGKINGANQAIVKTQANGQAAVTLTLGTASGKLNNVVEARALNGTKDLTNSPMTFAATAAPTNAYEMSIQGGGRQEGKAGEKLPSALTVKVKDLPGNGIPNHPVRFQTRRGGGYLGNNATDTTVTTDATGVARINWYLGGAIKPDSQIVDATANNGITALRNSPLKFAALATVGSPSAEGCFVLANPSTIPADGVANCQVTVHVCDKFGNPIAGVPVIIDVSGEVNNVKQPNNPTDSQGKAQGSFTTTRSGTKTVTARIIGGIIITRSAEVEATSLDARAVNPAGGNSQTGNTNAALPEPLKVKVGDKNGNGVPNYEVHVKVEQGGGKLYDRDSGQISDSLRVRTDAVGFANIAYICGPTSMENRIRVSAPGLANSPFLFLAQVIRPQPAKLAMISGNQQQGTVGEMLAQPIVVRVTDNNDRPVFGVPVSLKVTLGSGSVDQQSQVTLTSDVFGEVHGSWRLGAEAGLNYLRSESAGLNGSPFDFEAQAAPDRASALHVVGGNPAFGDVNGQSQPLVVRTVDALGNGVDGIAVIFELVEGAATLTDNYVVSSGGGLASVRVNFNAQSGWRKVRVTAQGLADSPTYMRAYARPLGASVMSVAERTNNQKGTKGKALNFPLQVKLLDGLGNPVPGMQVTFVIAAGGGNFAGTGSALAISDSTGIASAPWILGASSGSNQARAIKNGLVGSPAVFNATGFDNNFPIFDDVPDQRTVEEDLVRFSLRATDGDNDPIRYGAKNLPPGAAFDSLNTLAFSWRTDRSSAGRYEVSFLAYDTRGGIDEEVVSIEVLNRNEKPRFSSRFPVRPDTTLPQPGVPLRMRVNFIDPDGDILSYRWYVNGVFAGSLLNTFEFRGELKWNTVEALVFDLQDTVRTVWSIKVPVELVGFSAQVGDDGQAINLGWKTGSPTNDGGFNVLRSSAERGHYTRINERLIPANREGSYSYLDVTAEAGDRYYYKLEALDKQGNVTMHGPIVAEVALPKTFTLGQNYPNPFNPTTQIRYNLPAAVTVSLVIYNSLGQEVRKLVDDRQSPGYHIVVWDGRDQSGRPVPSGVYFYRLNAGNFTAAKKMLFAK